MRDREVTSNDVYGWWL